MAESTIDDESGQGYWWGQIVGKVLPKINPERVAKLLVKAMLGDNYHLAKTADNSLSLFAKSHPDAVMLALGEMMLDEEKRWLFHVKRFSVFLSLPYEVVAKWLSEKGTEGALRLARHVPRPLLDEKGEPLLHPPTKLLLSEFASDDEVFQEFVSGVHSLQTYMGDIAAQKEQEAELARKFLNHPVPRVHQWAEYEIESAKQQATMFRALDDKHRE